MKSPATTTILMGIVAAAISALASWFYPWPEIATRSDLVGKPLFEAFEAADVRTITITEFDADRNGVQQISLRRSGDNWVIPARQNFVANNASQISEAINSVNANVLEQRSNDLQDHVEFGVVDPLEFESTPAKKSLGKKIVLQDRNNRELASLIVGGSPSDDTNVRQTRRFVRIAGKPDVYVVELPEAALTTEFASWVSPNLLELTELSEIQSVSIQNYRLAKDQLSNPQRSKTWRYRLEMDVRANRQTLRTPSDNNELKEVVISAEQLNSIRQIGRYLANIPFTDARKKNRTLAESLKRVNPELVKELERLNEAGFVAIERVEDRSFGLQFESVAGELSLKKSDGTTFSLLVGDLVEAQSGVGTDLNRLVMLYASFDPKFFAQPKPPAEDADESEQKAYLRQVAERDEKIKAAESRVKLLNDFYADWYFVVSEQVIDGLIPELGLELQAQGQPGSPSPATETPAAPQNNAPADPFDSPAPSPAAAAESDPSRSRDSSADEPDQPDGT